MSLIDRSPKAFLAIAMLVLVIAVVPAWAEDSTNARAEELVRAMSEATGEAIDAAEAGNPDIEATKLAHVRYTGINKLRPLTPEPSAKWRGMGEYWIGFACMGLNDAEGELEAFEKAVLYLGQALDEERGASKALCAAYLGRARMLLHRNGLYSAEERAVDRAKAVEILEGALATGNLSAGLRSKVREWLTELQRGGDTGDLAITSDPPGAAILVDGEQTDGKTPRTLVLLDPGQHEIGLSLEGYNTARFSVTVEPGVTSSCEATLEPEVTIGTLAGTVVDDLGEPVTMATISVAGRTATTDAEGTFSVSEITRGEYAVGVSAPGHVDAGVSLTVQAGRTVRREITLQRKLGPVSGRVVNVSGEPIVGARVWLDGGHPRDTDQEGAFKFTSITEGMHLLKIAAPDYIEVERTVPLGWEGQITLRSVLPWISFRNDTGRSLRLFVQWHHPDHGWKERAWNATAGQQGYITTEGERIKADRIRHWGESADRRLTWRFTRQSEIVEVDGDATDTFAITYDRDDADDWIVLVREKLEAEDWSAVVDLTDQMLDRRPDSLGVAAALKAVAAADQGDVNAARSLLGEALEHSATSGRVAWMVENALDWALEAPHGGAARDRFVIPIFAWLLIGDPRQADSVCDRAIAQYDRDEYREDGKLRSLPAMAHLMRGIVRYVMDQDGGARGAWNEAERIAGKRQPVRKKARAFIEELAK